MVVALAAASHTTMATVAVARGFALTQNRVPAPANWRPEAVVVDATSQPVIDALLAMYGGQGVTKPELFAADVVFEDAAAQVVSLRELQEAFRALKVTSPETIAWDLVSSTVDEAERERTLDIDLWQRYRLGKAFEVYSRVVVRQGAEAGEIRLVQEKWNNADLLWTYPFPAVRRANGLLSYVLTSTFIRT